MKHFIDKLSESEKDTIKIGKELIKILPNEVNLIILKGELGTGKTTFVKGIAKALKIEENIVSPTYGYKRNYPGLSHYDLYLIKKIKSKNILSLISEELEENMVIIEWGNKIPKIKNCAIVTIKKISESARSIEVKLT